MLSTTEKNQPFLKSPNDINIDDYSVLNPQFPPDFYRWLSSLCPQNNCAWDVITGQGAIPVALTEYFSQVLGTETTKEKLQNTLTYPRVEHGILEQIKQLASEHSIDLVTLQNNYHQLDMDWFYDSLKSLTHADTAVVLWQIDSPQISPTIDALHHQFIDYVHQSRPNHSSHYFKSHEWPEWDLSKFHFSAIKSPRCQLIKNWTLQHFIDYLGSLSEVHDYFNSSGEDPRTEFIKRFITAWGLNVTHEVKWIAHCQAYKAEKP